MSLFLALVAVLVVALGGFWLAFTKASQIRTAGAGLSNAVTSFAGTPPIANVGLPSPSARETSAWKSGQVATSPSVST